MNMTCVPRPSALKSVHTARPFVIVCGGLPGLLCTSPRVASESAHFRDGVASDPVPRLDPVAKVTVQFTCSECGTTSGRWLGKCPGCGVFGSLVEELHGSPTPSASRQSP